MEIPINSFNDLLITIGLVGGAAGSIATIYHLYKSAKRGITNSVIGIFKDPENGVMQVLKDTLSNEITQAKSEVKKEIQDVRDCVDKKTEDQTIHFNKKLDNQTACFNSRLDDLDKTVNVQSKTLADHMTFYQESYVEYMDDKAKNESRLKKVERNRPQIKKSRKSKQR